MKQRIKHAYVQLSWLGALSIAVGLPGSALGQEAGETAELEEIVVTGSYLFTGLDSPSPVVVISGDELVNTAPADLATYFFDNVPQNNARQSSFDTENSFLARSRSIRTASVNLRGLGSENTLILLNGRRTIEAPNPGIAGWRRTDINTLVPRIAVGRSELLLDGGSALYGSDAVAGVINTVTRNNFEGFDLAVDTRFFEEDFGVKDITLAALFGAGNETSHVIAAIEWHETDRLNLDIATGDFENNPNVDPVSGSGLGEETNLSFTSAGRGAQTWIDPDCGNPAFGVPVLAYYPSYESTVDELIYLSPNIHTGATGTGDAPGTAATQCSQPNGFNTNTAVQSDSEQLSLFVAAEHNFSDRLYVKVEANVSRQRFNDLEIWGDRGGAAWNPSAPNALGPSYAIPVNHPGRLRAASLDPTFAQGRGGPQTIWMRGETLPFLQELEASSESDIMRAAFTLGGEINDDWNWQVDTTAAYNTVRSYSRDMIKENLTYAINGLGGASCDSASSDPLDPANDPARGVGNCFWYNPFMSAGLTNAASLQTGVSQTGLAVDPGMLDWLVPLRNDIFDAEFYSFDAQVTGFFGELPGGPIGLAVGAGVRSDTVSRDADRLVNAGLTASIGLFNDYSGRQKVENVYGELALPIHDDVNVQVAARYENYVGGFSETSPKVAVLWTPTDDLILRASFGKSFKAPTTIHTGAETLLQGGGRERVLVNGVQYGGMGGVRSSIRILPNPNLLPQTSDNFSVGFDYNATDNISVGASYIGIDFTDRISNPTGPQVVTDINCIYTDANGIPITTTGAPSGRIQWNVFGDPSLGAPLENTGGNVGCMIASDPNNGFAPVDFTGVGQMVGTPENLGYLNVEALDLRANMFWDTPIGMLSFTPNLSIFTKYEFPRGSIANADSMCPASGNPDIIADDVCDGVARDIGFAETAVQSIPRWSGTFQTALSFGNHNVRLTARYTDGINQLVGDLTAQDAANFNHQDGLWLLDANYFWQLNASSAINASVRNLFAEEPPITTGGNAAFFNRNRRTYSLQFTHSFGGN